MAFLLPSQKLIILIDQYLTETAKLNVQHECMLHVLHIVKVCTGRIFQARARPEREIEISVRAWPGPKEKMKIRPEPGPGRNKIQNFGPSPARHFFFLFWPDPHGFK